MGLRPGGLQIRWDRLGQWTGLKFQLNQSTCHKVGLQGRGKLLTEKAADVETQGSLTLRDVSIQKRSSWISQLSITQNGTILRNTNLQLLPI